MVAVLLMASLANHALAREDLATCTRVVDGDTIEVRIAGRIEKVRLIGVDTPETKDPRKPVEYFGKEASAFTTRIVQGKRVVLRDDPVNQNRDRYSRLLRYVFLEDGRLVNAEIIRQGYGFAYTKYPFSLMEEFRAHEREAREKGLGLWGSTEGATAPSASPAFSGSRLVGSSRTKKYHLLECAWVRNIDVANLSTFKSPEEALDRGYVPCAVCNPPTTTPKAQRAKPVAEPLRDPGTWQYSQSPSVTSKTYDGQATLVDAERREVEVLNEVGSFVWNLCSRPRTRDQIVTAVLDAYDTTRDAATKDVDEFLAELQGKGLVVVTK